MTNDTTGILGTARLDSQVDEAPGQTAAEHAAADHDAVNDSKS